MTAEAYFDQAYEGIEANPNHYAAFQKMMVRRAMAEEPRPRFCELVSATWPDA